MNLWFAILCSALFSLHASLEQKLITFEQNLSALKKSLPRPLPERPLTKAEQMALDLQAGKEKLRETPMSERPQKLSELQQILSPKIHAEEKELSTAEIAEKLTELSAEKDTNVKKLSLTELENLSSDLIVDVGAFFDLLETYRTRSDKDVTKEREFSTTLEILKRKVPEALKEYDDRTSKTQPKQDPLQRLKELLSQLKKDLITVQSASQLLTKSQQQQIQGRLGNYVDEKLKMQTSFKASFNDENIVDKISDAIDENRKKFTKIEPITSDAKEIAKNLMKTRQELMAKRRELVKKSKITAKDNSDFSALLSRYQDLVNENVHKIDKNYKDPELQSFKDFADELIARIMKQRRSALEQEEETTVD